MSEHQLASIILPVHNQEDHISELVDEFQQTLNALPIPFEFVLVVNACHDNSLAVCRELESRVDSVQVIHNEEAGWGRAVRSGISKAKGDLLCYANSARTSPQDLLLMILYGIANPNAVVKAHRRSRETLIRRVGSLVYNFQCRILFDLPTWDVNATPKVFSREMYDSIRLTSNGDMIDLEFYIKCKQKNCEILEVPIYKSSRRHGGESTTSFVSAARIYWGAVRMWKESIRNTTE